MQPQEMLILKAAALARTSSQQWQDFLEALDGYSNSQLASLIASPVAELQTKQGRAQALVDLLNYLGPNLHATAEKINQRETKR